MTVPATAGFKLITAVLPVECDALGVMERHLANRAFFVADTYFFPDMSRLR